MRRAVLIFFLFLPPVLIYGSRPQVRKIYQDVPKTAVIPDFVENELCEHTPTVHVTIRSKDVLAEVTPLIYGTNANVYMTQMVNQPGLIRSIRQLSPHIIRYPGGNLSNLFFWDDSADTPPPGIPDTLYGGVENRTLEQYWYGRNDSAGTLSVDNYYKMLKMTNCTGIITVNYGRARYGTGENPPIDAAHSAAEWVRYDHGRTRYWEIGNENFGAWQAGYRIDLSKNQDGQPEIITGDLYGRHFMMFADSMRKAAREVGTEIQVGAVLLEEAQDWHTPVQKGWNSGFFKEAGNAADFFVVHSYYTPYNENSTVETILNSAEHMTSEMLQFVQTVSEENGVEMKPLALTEWNIFARGSMQQVSFIDGIQNVLVLGELIRNKYAIANRWNLANSWAGGDDHGMFSRDGEPDVPLFNPRPSFHYLTWFQRFFGDHMVAASAAGDSQVVVYASTFSSGESGVVLVNKGEAEQIVRLEFMDFRPGKRCYWTTLTGGDDNGDFSRRVFVNGMGTDLPAGGPDPDSVKAYSSIIRGPIQLVLPGRGVVNVLVETKS